MFARLARGTQAADLTGRTKPCAPDIAERQSPNAQHLCQNFASRSFTCRDTPGHETFGEIASAQVKVSPDTAELTRLEKAWYGFPESVQDALTLIVNRTALSIGNDRPHFADEEWRFDYRQHTHRW